MIVGTLTRAILEKDALLSEMRETARLLELSFIEYGLNQVPQYEKLNQRLTELSDFVSEKELKEKLAQQSRAEADKVRLFVKQAVSEVQKLAQQQLSDAAKRLEAAEIALETQAKRLRCNYERITIRKLNEGRHEKASQTAREHAYQLELNQRLVFAQLVWLASDRKRGVSVHLSEPSKSTKTSARSSPGRGRPAGTIKHSMGVLHARPQSRHSESTCLCDEGQTTAHPFDQSKIITQINELFNEKDEKIKQAKEKEFLLKQQILMLRNTKAPEEVKASNGTGTQKGKPRCLSDRLRRAELRLAKAIAEAEKWQKCCDEKESELEAERTHTRDLQTVQKADMLTPRSTSGNYQADSFPDWDQLTLETTKLLTTLIGKIQPATMSSTSQQRTPSMECHHLACPGEASSSSQAQAISDCALKAGEQAELVDATQNEKFVGAHHPTCTMGSQSIQVDRTNARQPPALAESASLSIRPSLTACETDLSGTIFTRPVQDKGRPQCSTSRLPQRRQINVNNSQPSKQTSNKKTEGRSCSDSETPDCGVGKNRNEVTVNQSLMTKPCRRTLNSAGLRR
ncbi:hypothetical protein SprV_0301192300 [Sparganum proliferum]